MSDMSAQPVSADQPDDLHYPRAPLGRRLGAFAIDSLIAGLAVTMLSVSIVVVLFLVMSYRTPQFLQNVDEWVAWVWAMATAVSFVWFVFYSLFRDSLGAGQSWGKRLFRLRVIELDSLTSCGSRASIKRNLWGLLSVLVGVFLACAFPVVLLEPVVLLADARGQRLGDRWAHTQVIAAEALSGK
jgi:uncharacterized RDD family membrane protein YckC